MSVFSKFLKERIETMHVYVMHLSERLDTTSAVILKYMSGKELPQTVREVRRIGRSIPLSTPDQLALLESYYVTRYGANNYKCFQHISEMLRGIENYHLELSGDLRRFPFSGFCFRHYHRPVRKARFSKCFPGTPGQGAHSHRYGKAPDRIHIDPVSGADSPF